MIAALRSKFVEGQPDPNTRDAFADTAVTEERRPTVEIKLVDPKRTVTARPSEVAP